MRVVYTDQLLRIVGGLEDTLVLIGRLGDGVRSDTDHELKDLPQIITTTFNAHAAIPRQTIDYSSDVVIHMPDEFEFRIDVENLGRLARETLVRMIPYAAELWGERYQPIAELLMGGRNKALGRDEREELRRATLEVWSMPVKGKVFVLGQDISNPSDRIAATAAIRDAGGIVTDQVFPTCDYFVTDRPDLGRAAKAAGAKLVIDTLIERVMTGSRT
jgi:hypothetical protein